MDSETRDTLQQILAALTRVEAGLAALAPNPVAWALARKRALQALTDAETARIEADLVLHGNAFLTLPTADL